MNATILNREFQHPADGWYMIEPKGEHPNRRAGVVLVIDDEAIRTIATTFNREADEYPSLHNGMEFPGMLVDIEHFSDDASKETRAYAWLMRTQSREDGVYGRLKWTKTGNEAVDGGDYRFFSSEYLETDSVKLTGKRVRPLRLDGLTLTNKPSNKGGRPITSRATEFRPAKADPADVNQPKTKSMKNIASRLALSADASEEAIIGELNKYLSRADITTDALKVLQTENTNLKKSNEELLGAQVEADLVKYASRIKPEAKEKWKSRLLKDRAGTIELLEDMGEVEAKEEEPEEKTPRRVLNRNEASKPEIGKDGKQTASNDEARAKKIKSRADELKAANSTRPYDSCWKQANNEIK